MVKTKILFTYAYSFKIIVIYLTIFRILKDNHLNHLSLEAFMELHILTTLDLTSNYFTEIPYAITELVTLEKL